MQQITITDTSYTQWVEQLSQRYRQSQLKAAVKVNREMLRFYWSLGRDIVALKAEARWGSKFMKNLSRDLKHMMPDATCFSETNLKYMRYFYEMYSFLVENTSLPLVNANDRICPQPGDEMLVSISPQVGDQIPNAIWPQVVDKITEDIFAIPKQPHHNPTIGILVCKSKDNLLAQYSLEGSNQPIGISEYELEKLYPTKVEGMIPTIEEIEAKLSDRLAADGTDEKK